MHVLENQDDLGSVELRVLGRKVAHSSVVGEKIASSQELSDEVNEPFILVEAVILHDEGMLDDFEDLLLIFDMVYVLTLYDFRLFHGLYSKLLAFVLFEPTHLDISERTCR